MKGCLRGMPRKECLSAGVLAPFVLIAPLTAARQQSSPSPTAVDLAARSGLAVVRPLGTAPTSNDPHPATQESVSSTGRLTGSVRGPGGVPVPGATVTIAETTTGERKQTWTDEAGKFTLAGVKPGAYKLEVSLVGFQSDVRDSVSVTAGEPVQLSLTLKIASVTQQASSEAPRARTPLSHSSNAETPPGGFRNRVRNSGMGESMAMGDETGSS